jgi:hypothetical protein
MAGVSLKDLSNKRDGLLEVEDDALFGFFLCQYMEYHWTMEVTLFILFFEVLAELT